MLPRKELLLTLPSPFYACRPTGGNTGIPWGTGGVWVEPVDEEAAQRTIDRLQQFWHKKGDGFGTLIRGGGPADPSVAVPPGEVEGLISANDAYSDSEGGDSAVVARKGAATGPAVNAVCLHVACSPHAFCLVEQLEAVRDSYGKSRSTHFNRKPILVWPTPSWLVNPLQRFCLRRCRMSFVLCLPRLSFAAGSNHSGLDARRAAAVSGCVKAQPGQEDDGEPAQF